MARSVRSADPLPSTLKDIDVTGTSPLLPSPIRFIRLFFIPLFLTLFISIGALLSPSKVLAATYRDVTDFLNNNPAPTGCVNWVEGFTDPASGANGYKVWRRCNSHRTAEAKIWLLAENEGI